MSVEFSCEEKLMKLCPELHKKYSDSVFASIRVLTNYRAIFPDYTDHSYLHTMNVLEYSNRIIGSNIDTLNCGEIYTLMMAVSLHDTGMGISDTDYAEFITEPALADYALKNADAPRQQIIRDLHHELSGCFIRKYSKLFEIPEEFVFPIIQAARGHRRTDLYSEQEYPAEYQAGKYKICLPYISAVIRLADELDIAAERNISLDRTISEIKNAYSISVWRLHSAIKDIVLTEKKCIVFAEKSRISEDDAEELAKWVQKLKTVVEYTADVARSRTPYKMTKRKVALEYV